MSTKIFNGFRIQATDLSAIESACASFKGLLGKVRAAKETEFIAITACDLIDRAVGEQNPLSAAYQELIDRQQKIITSQHRDPRVDMEFRVTFWPLDDCVLGYVRCEHEEWLDMWMNLPEIEVYGYYNNADRPSDISEDDWKKREHDWDVALKRLPFVVDIESVRSYYDPPSPEELLSFVPSKAFRAMVLAKQQVGSELFAERGYGPGNAVDAIRYLTSREGKQRIAERAATIETGLVEVTMAILTGKI